MKRVQGWMVATACLVIGVLGSCCGAMASGFRSCLRLRRRHWTLCLAVMLVGATLIAPVASAQSRPATPAHRSAIEASARQTSGPTGSAGQPSTNKPVVVACNLNARDPLDVDLVMAAKNPDLLNAMTAGCHIPADGQMTKCALEIPVDPTIYNMKRMTPPCFIHRPRVRFIIYDPLGEFQSEEWAHISLDDDPIEAMHIYETKPGEVLLVGVDKAREYRYKMDIESHYDKGGCPPLLKRIGQGNIDVRNGSVFVGMEESCHEQLIWLKDMTPFFNESRAMH